MVTYEYFMDKMSDYEVSLLVEEIPYVNMDWWEGIRSVVYTTAQVQSTKKIKPSDMMKFKWDDKEEHITEISNDDIDHLNKLSEQIRKKYYG